MVLEGRDITGMPPHDVCRLGMGRSFQRTNIFPRLTVFQNVQAALLSHRGRGLDFFARVERLYREETEALLASLGLLDHAGEVGGYLSHGAQKQLELGIALASEPRLLLLDEPTAGMSAAETRDIDGDFDGLLVDWKDKGHTVTFEGKEPVSGADAYKLKVTTKAGAVRYVYLDAKTYLERRQTGQVVLANNRRENTVIDFSNYKAIDAVQFPFNIDEDRTGPQIAQSFATYTEKIELNVPMDDALFATPQAPAIGTPNSPGVSGARQAPR